MNELAELTTVAGSEGEPLFFNYLRDMLIAVIVFVLTVKLKHRYRLSQNLNEVLQILSVTILEKTHVFQLFSEVRRADEIDPFRNQLTLFDL